MAGSQFRYLEPAATGRLIPADARLEQVAALLANSDKMTPALLRIQILCIIEGREVPSEMKEFLKVAERAGVKNTPRYQAWGQVSSGAPITLPEVVREYKVRDRSPKVPGVALYRWYDIDDALLYVGISSELPVRVNAHFKRSTWMEFAVRSSVARYETREEAEAAEEAAIKAEHPLFNQTHNNTPESRERLVEYLVMRGRTDLLAPAVSRR